MIHFKWTPDAPSTVIMEDGSFAFTFHEVEHLPALWRDTIKDTIAEYGDSFILTFNHKTESGIPDISIHLGDEL